jgi:hypothetical protein
MIMPTCAALLARSRFLQSRIAARLGIFALVGCGSPPTAEAPLVVTAPPSVAAQAPSTSTVLVTPSAVASLATSTPSRGAQDCQHRLDEVGAPERTGASDCEPKRRAEMLSETLAIRTPRILPVPPFVAFTRSGLAPTPSSAPRLVQLSKRRNGITDGDAWFQSNGLARHGFIGPRPVGGGDVPVGLPVRVDSWLILWGHKSALHTTLVLGRDWRGGQRVAVLDAANRPIEVFDFAAWARAPFTEPGAEPFVEQSVSWAEVHDDVLYVATGHSTYAKSSGGKNAFVSAVDLRSGELLWQSAPLVSNAENFLVIGDWVVCGYGFTAEPDALFVLDRATGKTAARVPLPSGPTYLVLKDGTLFVRTYDHDLTFRIQLPVAAPLHEGR